MDTSALNTRFNNLGDALEKKIDKDDLKMLEERMKKYTDKTESLLKMEVEQHIKSVKFQHERLLAEFEQHRDTDFEELKNKVDDLSKKVFKMTKTLANKTGGGG